MIWILLTNFTLKHFYFLSGVFWALSVDEDESGFSAAASASARACGTSPAKSAAAVPVTQLLHEGSMGPFSTLLGEGNIGKNTQLGLHSLPTVEMRRQLQNLEVLFVVNTLLSIVSPPFASGRKKGREGERSVIILKPTQPIGLGFV